MKDSGGSIGVPKTPTITISVGTSLREMERLTIEATLRFSDGNLAAAAKILGIDRGTLYEKIRQYEIPRWPD